MRRLSEGNESGAIWGYDASSGAGAERVERVRDRVGEEIGSLSRCGELRMGSWELNPVGVGGLHDPGLFQRVVQYRFFYCCEHQSNLFIEIRQTAR